MELGSIQCCRKALQGAAQNERLIDRREKKNYIGQKFRSIKRKEGQRRRSKLFYFLFLTEQITVLNDNSNNVLGGYSLWISEMNASNVISDRGEELGIL